MKYTARYYTTADGKKHTLRKEIKEGLIIQNHANKKRFLIVSFDLERNVAKIAVGIAGRSIEADYLISSLVRELNNGTFSTIETFKPIK